MNKQDAVYEKNQTLLKPTRGVLGSYYRLNQIDAINWQRALLCQFSVTSSICSRYFQDFVEGFNCAIVNSMSLFPKIHIRVHFQEMLKFIYFSDLFSKGYCPEIICRLLYCLWLFIGNMISSIDANSNSHLIYHITSYIIYLFHIFW